MPDDDWLLLVNRDGVVEAATGGAPGSWIGRKIDDCNGAPDALRAAARRLVRAMALPVAGTLLRRERVGPDAPGAPSFTLVAVEAVLMRPVDVPLGPLLRRAVEPLAQQAAREHVSLHVDIDEEASLAATVDAEKIGWALGALVGNALRYVRRGDDALPGGNVRVSASRARAQRMIHVEVQDDGPGIPAYLRPWIFEPDPGTGRAAGVGLRLVHDIVAAHGGGMVLKSNAGPHERGTTVTVWLPACDAQGAARAAE